MMKVMILAAGLGTRMRPLTDQMPKPLVSVAGTPLIGHLLAHIAKRGFQDVVINVSYLGDQIQAYCGDGERWGLHIQYSEEPNSPLGTAGGIAKALPLLGTDPFWVLSADVYSHFPFEVDARLQNKAGAHLILVDNPVWHPTGDFFWEPASGLVLNQPAEGTTTTLPSRLTYASLGLMSADFLKDVLPGSRAELGLLFQQAADRRQLTGVRYDGVWFNVGTPADRAELESFLVTRATSFI